MCLCVVCLCVFYFMCVCLYVKTVSVGGWKHLLIRSASVVSLTKVSGNIAFIAQANNGTRHPNVTQAGQVKSFSSGFQPGIAGYFYSASSEPFSKFRLSRKCNLRKASNVSSSVVLVCRGRFYLSALTVNRRGEELVVWSLPACVGLLAEALCILLHEYHSNDLEGRLIVFLSGLVPWNESRGETNALLG